MCTLFGTVLNATESVKMETFSPSIATTVDVRYPTGIKGKLPLVIFAHNGGSKKEAWEDYPAELAARGYMTASIGWATSSGHADYNEVFDTLLTKYSEKLDTNRIAFVGGCHGAVKMIDLLNDPSQKMTFKALVFLSVSESLKLEAKQHAPILGIYSTDDHLGDYYKSFTKTYVEETITASKKVIAFKGTPHGNELVADAKSKELIRKEINEWLTTNVR